MSSHITQATLASPLAFITHLPQHLIAHRLPRLNALPQRPVVMSSPAVTFVTGNENKLREVAQILNADSSAAPFSVISQKIDLPELQGEPDDIVRQKCELAVKHVRGPTVSEN